MSTESVNNMYGFASDEVKQVTFAFGLNPGTTFLKKFEWIPNGGAEGAEKEALEIIFTINGTDKSYRKFPVTQGFGKKGEVITDPNSAEFKEAVNTLNTVIVHILHCFVDTSVIQKAMSVPIASFKQFCSIAASVLPKNFNEIPLDIFMQYQWKIGTGQNRTFLEIPSSMKNGKWLCPAIKPLPDKDGNNAEWKEVRKKEPADGDQKALIYVDGANNVHTFTRYGRYMNGNLANQQKSEEAQQEEAAASNISQSGSSDAPTTSTTEAGW